jgi:hypothetical protein
MEFFRSVLDCPLALGSVHNRVMRAVAQARQSNAVEDLHAVRAAGHDEIFQSGQKVAVGVAGFDLVLSAGGRGKPRRRDRGDPSVWDLTAKGLQPDYTVVDGGKGLRAGQALAWPEVPCHGDTFHAAQELGMTTSIVLYASGVARLLLSSILSYQMKCWQEHQG